MGLEMTENRLKFLAGFDGKITLDGEYQNEIVVRISFGDGTTSIYAEKIYNNLLNIADERCENCGRYCPEGLNDGICEDCLK